MTASPVQPASAAMPSEEEIARVLEPQAWAALGCGDTLAYANRRKSSLRKARAVLALFAPILAEKERLAGIADHAARHWQQTQAAFQACLDATGSKDGAELVDKAARALAAEAALEKAEGFDFGNGITVESRGDGRWAVNNCGCVLNSDGDWEHEPRPSSRDDDFISRTRFDRDEAFRRAAAIRAQGE